MDTGALTMSRNSFSIIEFVPLVAVSLKSYTISLFYFKHVMPDDKGIYMVADSAYGLRERAEMFIMRIPDKIFSKVPAKLSCQAVPSAFIRFL
jgi:hypothetical protein